MLFLNLNKEQRKFYRAAMLTAASFLEHNPKAYSFMNLCVPSDKRDTGCMIGWFLFFAGLPGDKIDTLNTTISWGTEKLFNKKYSDIQDALSKIANPLAFLSPDEASRVMRRFADRYFFE